MLLSQIYQIPVLPIDKMSVLKAKGKCPALPFLSNDLIWIFALYSQVVEKQREKLQKTVPVEKREKTRKYRLIEKEYQKRKQKFDDARLKATKARNEYLLCMDAANASIQKYFVDDLSDLIDCMDFGFHQSLYRAVMMHSTGTEQLRRSLHTDIDR